MAFAKVEKVMVLLPDTAVVVVLVQDPEYVIVPVSLAVNVKVGVCVVVHETTHAVSIGAVVSRKKLIVPELVFPALSVTITFRT